MATIIGNFFKHTFIYKFYSVIRDTIYYFRDYRLVSDTLYSDAFKRVIKKYLNLNLKKDWIGRLYGVLNPNIDINGNIDFNNMVFEIDGEFTNNNEGVKTFVYKQMDLIGNLFKIDKLYDYISCNIDRIDKFDNFLVVFDITSRKDMVSAWKKFFIHFLIYAIIAVILLIIFL